MAVTYGIDAHLLLRERLDGVPRYAWNVLEAMMRMPLHEGERVVLYAHNNKPEGLVLPEHWTWNVLKWPISRGWTHGRLSLEMLLHPPSVLFIPGHEIPLFVRGSTRVVTTVHDIAFRTVPDVYEAPQIRRQTLAVARALSRAAVILSPSEATRQDLVREYAFPSDRIVVTPLAPTLPVAVGDAQEVLRKYRVTESKYIIAVSRLEKKKNTLLLVRAFGLLKRKLGHGHPLTLVLAGAFGFGEQDIRRAIVEEGLEADVRLPGYVNDHDLSPLLSHALCYAFPSRAEGFGIGILEAMNHHVPVVASAIPSSKEVAGDAAILVSENDVQAFARVLESLVHNTQLRSQYIALGSERVKQFSWDLCAQKTWEALRSLVR